MKLICIFMVGMCTLIALHAQAQSNEKSLVIVTASYKNAEWYKWNLDSVFEQDYENWRMIYVDDCSPDGTGQLVASYVKERGFEDRVAVICNKERRGAMANQYAAIHLCRPTDIIVILDGDDRLADSTALQEVNSMYTSGDIWLTYGQYKRYPDGNMGICKPYPPDVIVRNAFREHPWLLSHLRTFYAGLFHKIKLADLKLDGEFFPMACDLALMFPMIEMARDHFMFCPKILLEYNLSNPINDHKVSQQLQMKCANVIRARKRYGKIGNPF